MRHPCYCALSKPTFPLCKWRRRSTYMAWNSYTFFQSPGGSSIMILLAYTKRNGHGTYWWVDMGKASKVGKECSSSAMHCVIYTKSLSAAGAACSSRSCRRHCRQSALKVWHLSAVTWRSPVGLYVNYYSAGTFILPSSSLKAIWTSKQMGSLMDVYEWHRDCCWATLRDVHSWR